MKIAASRIWVSLLFIPVVVAAVILYSVFWHTPPPPARVMVGVSLEPITGLFMIADEMGYFTQNRLDIKIKYYIGGGADAFKDMLDGKIDMVTAAENIVVFNSLKRQDFKIVATIGSSDNDPRILARKGRGITSPKDLRDKRIGTISGTGVHYFLYLFLLKYGLTEGDTRLSLQPGDKTFDSFISGELDAISTREPYVGKAAGILGDKIIIFEEPRLFIKNYDLLAMDGMIQRQQETIKLVLQGLIQAQRFVEENPGVSHHIIAKKLNIDKEKIDKIMSDTRLKVFLGQSMYIRMEEMAQWMVDNRIVVGQTVPDLFKMTHIDALQSVKPDAVTIVK